MTIFNVVLQKWNPWLDWNIKNDTIGYIHFQVILASRYLKIFDLNSEITQAENMTAS